MADQRDDEKKRGRKVRVDFRKNRAKPARDKGGWTREHRAGRSDDTNQSESVRAKGDLSRKRTIIVSDETAQQKGLSTGIVVAMRGLVAEVDDGARLWACSTRRKLKTFLIAERVPLTVGDEVRFSPGGGLTQSGDRELPEGVIEEVAPRRTSLLRQYERKVQMLAANVDTAVITLSADQPTLRPHLIDRYLVAIHKGDMRPIVCINKADLDASGLAAEVVERYAALGYKSLLASIVDNRGLDELKSLIANQTSVFVGPSGVGKSSLLNAIEPGMNLKIGTLSDLERGRHTTTTSRLLKWSFGGYVVDTPGMRQFELADVESSDLEAYFIEFRDLVSQCKFPSCTHRHEGGCAIVDAVEAGRITPERYDSYVKMFEECLDREHY